MGMSTKPKTKRVKTKTVAMLVARGGGGIRKERRIPENRLVGRVHGGEGQNRTYRAPKLHRKEKKTKEKRKQKKED